MVLSEVFNLGGKFHWVPLFWMLGALVYFFLYDAWAYLALGIGFSIFHTLFLFYDYWETIPNYFSLIIIATLTYIAYKRSSRISQLGNIVHYFIWVMCIVIWYLDSLSAMILAVMITALVVYAVGLAHRNEFTPVYTIAAMCALVPSTYLLSFRITIEDLFVYAPPIYFLCIAIAATLILCMYSREYKLYTVSLELVALIVGSITALSLLFTDFILFNLASVNLLLYLIAIGSIYYGFVTNNLILFNVGIGMFILFTITRYFDLLWEILPRSVFFIAGGVVLLVGSFLLERERRKTVEKMHHG